MAELIPLGNTLFGFLLVFVGSEKGGITAGGVFGLGCFQVSVDPLSPSVLWLLPAPVDGAGAP